MQKTAQECVIQRHIDLERYTKDTKDTYDTYEVIYILATC